MRILLLRLPLIGFAYLLITLSLTPRTAAADTVRHLVHIEGQGRPVIVFESGLGDTLDAWKDVQGSIAAGCARTVSYNRAGYPGSDPAKGPRDADTIVNELRSELQRNGMAPPYVLV